ncbi:MAG: cyclopropane-fatty-acyl-phospholipid synthase family protein [Alphaproteobacteria bacterium]
MHADLTFDRAGRRPGPMERAALRLLGRIGAGHLTLHRHDGTAVDFRGAEPGPQVAVKVNNPRLFRRLALGGDIALAEAYRDGDWDTADLTDLLTFGALNRDRLGEGLDGSVAMRAAARLVHALRRNSRAGARRNIAAHYDLGNAFYAAWLDPSLTYSAGLFAADDDDLAAAQVRKYRRLAELAAIGRDDHVLEIGCGWGGFALWAARTIGCRVTAITLSAAQAAHLRDAAARAGLADRVAVRLQDYRDVDGRFDRIVSIEMLEAVGEANWAAYFAAVRTLLRPGGRAALQVITIADARFAAYRRRVDFIQRHIFPGGMLPSPSALRRHAADSGLDWIAASRHGEDYAATLVHWQRRFEAAAPQVAALGFDARFRRMWRYYLAYCEAGFRTGRIDLLQVALARPAEAGA